MAFKYLKCYVPGILSAVASGRQIQNTHTGLDLSVPEYQEIRGRMMSGHVEYHIVVVTRLAAFKSAKHKPEDVVQFMVSKKYSEIEELYQRLAARYPQASLPLLPRKVLFVGESDICERRAMFNDIMKFISKDEDLATSPELLEFLGTKSTSAIDFKGKNIPDDKEKEDEENEALDFFKEENTPDLISQLSSVENAKKGEQKEEEEEEEDLDPLGIIRTKKTKKASAPPTKEEKPKLTIFEEEVDPDEGVFGPEKNFSSIGPRKKMKENLKLFEDPDLGGVVRLGDSLLLPAACKNREYVLNTGPEEDTEKLLRVEDDLEKLLKVTSKPKPKVPSKPPLPQKPAVAPRSTNSSLLAKPKENRIQTMNELDILQYIQENESINNQDTSLF
ncbi:PREDICTED: HCLS1-binding protein 3 [Aptenodytes forsteri]|uniref:HCLS1-binding protein 3 n=1 Tax=Aptenodytes forsteri TaxID=9233 RepID=UPI000904F055|nr:PREDICTED: HCLS1-binding protein 3 [Aptenodytes forsteri]